jgi:phage protein D/phage baseplate assembly protein gpV
MASTVDRPALELRIGGSSVDPRLAADVVEVEVAEEVLRHARCTLLLQNWKADERAVRWSDHGPLKPGAEVELLLGYSSDLTQVFSGVVTALTANFSQDRAPTLQVEARSRSILLAGPPRALVFEETTDEDLVSSLAADVGLDADAGTGIQRPGILVDRCRIWPYLVGRARELGWVAYVRGKRLVVRPPAEPDDPVELTWNRDLVELRLTQDVGTLPSRSSAAAWDSEAQEQTSASADSPTGGLTTGDRQDHSAAVGDTGWAMREEVSSTAAAGGAEVSDRAAGLARTSELRHITGSGRTVGLPTLRCDSWVSIVGAGTRFSGPYYVGTVRHRLGRAGFSTEFGLGLPATLTPEPATAGPAGRLLLGVVTDLADPDGHARIRVAFPWTGGADAIWARLATPYAGNNQGFFAVPDVDQEVVVGFVDGSADDPVVLGSLWSGAAAPPAAPDDDNTVRSVVTRSGHQLIFDDADEGSVKLTTNGGHELVMDDGEKSVTVAASGGNKIIISDDGIELAADHGDLTLSASSGEVKIAGMSISGKADSGATLESSSTLDIKASATLGLRGATVNIN